jgi:hypothetical protein
VHRHHTGHRHCALIVVVVSASLVWGCSRGRPQLETLTSSTLVKDTAVYTSLVSEQGPSVFTDTALFRRVCVEADSGACHIQPRRR